MVLIVGVKSFLYSCNYISALSRLKADIIFWTKTKTFGEYEAFTVFINHGFIK